MAFLKGFIRANRWSRFARALICVGTAALMMGQSHREVQGMGEFAGITRLLSYAIRDTPPTLEELSDVHSQEALRQMVEKWLTTPEFSQRLVRHFTDLLGVNESNFFLSSHLILKENPEGILTLDDKKSCDAGEATRVDAWWTTGNSQVLVCNDALSDALRYPIDSKNIAVCTLRGGAWGMGDPRCGCGPKLIGCFPQNLLPALQQEMVFEVGSRGVQVVQQNGTWMDFLGGSYFWGTRLLYWRYLLAQSMFISGNLPTKEELAKLESLSVTEKQKIDFPNGIFPRGGILSSLSFLIQYPNFRSRTRVLVEAFLCRKVDGSLNTHDLSSYLNKDMGTIDIKHATRSDCAVCHYGLDNLATMLLGFSGTGSIDPGSKISQAGMAFGTKDSGAPGFARSLVERSPWFHKCMAQKAWEGFSGESFKNLSLADKNTLTDASQQGPRTLVMTLLQQMVYGLRPGRQVTVFVDGDGAMPGGQASGSQGGPAPAEKPKMPFSTVDPLIRKYCAGSSCHSQGSSFPVLVGQEDRVRQLGNVIKERLLLTGGGRMPPGSRQLEAAEKEQFINYLDQL
jgi:hypothetical protein